MTTLVILSVKVIIVYLIFCSVSSRISDPNPKQSLSGRSAGPSSLSQTSASVKVTAKKVVPPAGEFDQFNLFSIEKTVPLSYLIPSND